MNYAHFDIETTPLGRSRTHVRNRDGAVSRVLSPAESRVFLACSVPRPLPEQIAECCRILPPALIATLPGAGAAAGEERGPGWAEAAVGACLEGLITEGLLTAESRVVEFLRERAPGPGESSPPPCITSLCIPTRDRPVTLRRALESFLENGTVHGRSTRVVVLDDSDSREAQAQNRAVLRELGGRFAVPAVRATRERRERYAQELAAFAGIPAGAVRFALLGDPRFPSTYGATRNALLLDTVGELCMQVDDDIVCMVCRPPDAADELLVSPDTDPNEYWFERDLAGALRRVQVVEEDFLSLHEQVLGRSPAECFASGESGPVRVAAPWSSRHLARLMAPDARVAVSFAGIVGDCGGPGRHHWRLSLRGASFARLVENADSFRERLLSRQLVKCATRTVLSTGPYCMAGNMGLDNRTLLPPFVPVGIAEDALFGMLRAALFPHLASASLPYAIVHDPVPARPNRSEPVAMTMYANAVLSSLTARFCEVWPVGGADSLKQLGAYLVSLGTIPEAAFAAEARRTVLRALAASVSQAESVLLSWGDAPPHWRASMQENLEELLALVAREDPSAPGDLPGSETDRRALLQLLLREYGEVLVHWREIVEAAAELRRCGQGLTEEA